IECASVISTPPGKAFAIDPPPHEGAVYGTRVGRSLPHLLQAGAYVQSSVAGFFGQRVRGGSGALESGGFQCFQHLVGQEAAAAAVDVRIAEAMLCSEVEFKGREQQEVVLGAGEADIEQAPLLVDELGLAGRELGGEAAIDHVEEVDRIPLHPFGGVDGGEDEVVLIERGTAGEIARRIGGVEGELRQEALAGGVLAGKHLELIEVAEPSVKMLVLPLEMRAIPFAREMHLSRPRALRVREREEQLDELAPVLRSPGRRGKGLQG